MLSQKRGSSLPRALCAKAVFVMGIAAAVLVSAIAANAEIIYPRAVYVDLGHATPDAYQTGTNWANVRNGGGTTSNLIDINGIATEIDLAVSSASSSSGNGLMPASGTDAYNLFNGYVNAQGFSNVPNDTISLTFSGLDPSLRYDFAIFGNRIDDTHVTADERFVLSGVEEGFSNISSTGTTIATTTMTDDTTFFDTRANTVNGYVARWDSIAPGLDGSFTVDATWVGSGSGVVYLNAARLEIVPEPSSLLLLATGLLGLLCLRRRRGKE